VSWRWKSKFARLIQDYGVKSIWLAPYVRSSAIYHWNDGESHVSFLGPAGTLVTAIALHNSRLKL
jgi:hypothetical protein